MKPHKGYPHVHLQPAYPRIGSAMNRLALHVVRNGFTEYVVPRGCHFGHCHHPVMRTWCDFRTRKDGQAITRNSLAESVEFHEESRM
jgi:hypothetical protein